MSRQEHLKTDKATSPKKINPLLSASVIGFPAFPIGLLPPEPKFLVTVGESLSFDSENLDEINLNSPPEIAGPAAIIDTNSNPLQEENIQNDSLLSQAASSFSALPAVASSVFSTFSKRIYAGNSREQSPFSDSADNDINANINCSQLNSHTQQRNPLSEQEAYFLSPSVPQAGGASVETNLNSLQTELTEFIVPEPPKLYSPIELSSKTVCPPPISGAQNSYRLTAKKKIYAPIPGLSGQTESIKTLQINTEVVSTENPTNNYPQQPNVSSLESTNKQEERKGGLFSLTNFVPTGVLQNISGLVQTAAETLNPSTKSEGNSAISVSDSQIHSFYSTPQSSTNFFVPPPSASPDFKQIAQLPPKSTSQKVTSEVVPVSSFITPPPAFSEQPINVDNTSLSSVKNINSFNPSEVFNQENLQNTQNQLQHSQSVSVALSPIAPPPTIGNISFRLQKGTRHYKNPLDSTEIAPSYTSQQQVEVNSQAIANPITPNYFGLQSTNTDDIKHNSLQNSHLFNDSVQDRNVDIQKSEKLSKQTFEPFSYAQIANNSSGDLNVQQGLETKDFSLNSCERTTNTIAPLSIEHNSFRSESNFSSPIDLNADITSVKKVSPEISNPSRISSNTSQNNCPPPALLPLPTVSSSEQKPANPYRKGPIEATQAVNSSFSQPSLASFFTPSGDNSIKNLGIEDNYTGHFSSEVPSNSAANFFGEARVETKEIITESSYTELPTIFNPSISTLPREDIDKETNEIISLPTVPPPIGFENFTTDNKKTVTNLESTSAENANSLKISNFEGIKSLNNSCSQLFGDVINKSDNIPEIILSEKQINFFDSFSAQKNDLPNTLVDTVSKIQLNDSSNSNEDQIIQNFFNNPPPKENSNEVGDLNYDLVHSGLGVHVQHSGSLTTASNIVEPPSSACSEFSELNSDLSQRFLQSVGSAEIKAEEKSSKTNEAELLKEKYNDLPEEILREIRMSGEKTTPTLASTAMTYTPAVKHWFFKRAVGQKYIWMPFSHYDSALLETSLTAEHASSIVSVEGGRYDVNLPERIKIPVYWEGVPIEVRRCSWFYKASDSKYVPYDEDTADRLEAEYREAAESGVWHKKIIIARNEQVVFHGPTVIVHFQQQQNVDAWGGTSQTTSRPRVVKRDLEDFTIEQGESERADHLLLMVHGIGSACDLKMRTVEEVVDDFRKIATALVQSHYKNSTDMGIVGRVEVLPISWHSHLHSEEMDEKLKSITLESIPKLRNFTNDTLLDVLFYTSPTFCQKIMNTVATAMNTLYMRYRERHPDFSGGVSLAGHSLGSLILFDLLCHQRPVKECEEQNLENPNQFYGANQYSVDSGTQTSVQNVTSQQISYTVGPAGTGQPYIQYPQLVFFPKKFFALGSPIGMFVTIRGIDKLGLEFRLPTCPGFYNIFHPFDPVAYRIEALVNPDLSGVRPVLIPHHKGRKRMHLELKETMTRVGADLKQRFLDTFKNTLDSVNFISSARNKREAEENMEKEVDQVIAMQIEMERQHETTEQDLSQIQTEATGTSIRSRANSNSTTQSDTDVVEIDFPLGKLNDSKRIDYVLQEAPLEFFNEYLFALSSHVCYWDSSDTILFVMKEIYSGMGISPDSQIPQQTMTIERPSSRNSVSHSILPPTI